jgi:aspartyl-tRNA(Asn)/glutamyl-tRNA(Gln) amidotransferase subunit B
MTPGFEMVVGLEVHAQLDTRTKIFCDCRTTFGDPPNTHTCPVCLGLPGALPVLNGQAVRLGVRAALALECTVHAVSVFARKNYFYPDLPKGYQISQYDQPFATNGRILLSPGVGAVDHLPARTIRITRIHFEEDAGKLVHDRYADYTAVDLNRAGTPLIEIVSEPDLRSAADAREYLRRLKEILEHTDVSDANMEEGSLRVDANVSVRPVGASSLGTKTEIKNMNSFSGVERALDVEFARQCAIVGSGGRVQQETLLYDAATNQVRSARTKEEAHDYRYFPEPDLPPLFLTDAFVAEQRAALPELPEARRRRFEAEFGLTAADAGVLVSSRAIADYFEAVVSHQADAKAAAAWVIGDVLAWLNDRHASIHQLLVTPRQLGALVGLVREGTLSRGAAKRVFARMSVSGEEPDVVMEREGLRQVGDHAALQAWVEEVWAAHPEEAARFVAGDQKLLGVLVGLVMKRSAGRADPKRVNALVRARAARA